MLCTSHSVMSRLVGLGLRFKNLRTFSSSSLNSSFSIISKNIEKNQHQIISSQFNKVQVRHHNLGTASYEGDGKTTVTILNHEIDSPLMVDTYTDKGFRLNNGMSVVGPIALFPGTVLGWDVASAADITPESLSLFVALEPRLDILVIGTGETGTQLDPKIITYLKEHKISVEALPTEYACQTFNFLNVERRCVAGALIPPAVIRDGYLVEELKEKLRRKKLYEQD